MEQIQRWTEKGNTRWWEWFNSFMQNVKFWADCIKDMSSTLQYLFYITQKYEYGQPFLFLFCCGKLSFISFRRSSLALGNMITSLNGNIFRVTGPLLGDFNGHRCIPLTKASDAELLFIFFICAFNKRLSKQSWGWWFDTPSRSLWRHCNVNIWFPPWQCVNQQVPSLMMSQRVLFCEMYFRS